MGYLDSLKSLFTASASGQEQDTHWIYVRCQRCGESIKTRLDLRNNLTPRDEGGYIARKTLVGNQLCFERIEVTLIFDEQRRLVEQEALRGELITAEEFEAASSSANH
jgi:hypothetical protein